MEVILCIFCFKWPRISVLLSDKVVVVLWPLSGDAFKTEVGSELVVYRSSFCLHQREGTKK